MESIELYRTNLEYQLAESTNRINLLLAMLTNATTEIKVENVTLLDKMQNRHYNMSNKLRKLNRSNSKILQGLLARTFLLLNSLENSIRHTFSLFYQHKIVNPHMNTTAFVNVSLPRAHS